MKKTFRIRIHPAGAVLLGAAFFFCPSYKVLACAFALLLHEGGHLAALKLCGVQNCAIELTPFGGMADCRCFERLSPFKQTLCAGAGPMVSMLGFILGGALQDKSLFANAFRMANLSLLFVNCLPVWPLDGARILLALATSVGKERTVQQLLSILAWIAGLAMMGVGLYGAWEGWINPSLLLCGPYLCYASAWGNVTRRVRGMEEIRTRWKYADELPVRAVACELKRKKELLPRLLGKSEGGRYQIIFLIDSQTGRIAEAVTEQEALEDIVDSET